MKEILLACWKVIRGESFLYKQDISSHTINYGCFIKCNITKDNNIMKSYLSNCDVDLNVVDVKKNKKRKKSIRTIKTYRLSKVRKRK